jgi:hypothetical protein
MKQKPFTKAILKTLPAMKAQDGKDHIVYAKFFNPCGAQNYYVLEFDQKTDKNPDGDDDTMFCYVADNEYRGELGYVSLNELKAIKLGWGLTIERDIHFSPTPLSEVKKSHTR